MWKYQTIKLIQPLKDTSTIDDILNAYGEDDWEVYGIEANERCMIIGSIKGQVGVDYTIRLKNIFNNMHSFKFQ